LEDRIVKNHFNEVDLNFDDEDDSAKKEKKYKKTLRDKFRMNSQSNLTDIDKFYSIVKNKWTPINKKVIMATDLEIEMNPRARSAKLRVAVKN
jgi:16S rRNA C1402 N4-methylase RsmH